VRKGLTSNKKEINKMINTGTTATLLGSYPSPMTLQFSDGSGLVIHRDEGQTDNEWRSWIDTLIEMAVGPDGRAEFHLTRDAFETHRA